ncbi:hypothetical protein VOLCADRAFT_105930 [Volvox carteri f. nagariensis]|uniref:RING-type E3 ubiquitin transferase n=1 Tax=Volvox carteri f. nagariensis TaxID=3068 RepID=D8U4C2_VOLCA|nr:uncharacterized protein VOLCADRAFT_105930 [Volvox carteri f. nagariensis]EFJ45378.1 hypothetical protein VOLCADRAFT_105930 [Volvox carteri f. nagariensis]|eukprot:XP_002953405.1 hypothetical protein VOLCADRAFT_105930 [Volvox carteri f. nagariensis]
MAMHDDLCLVCADPLEFTAFGSCGHKEVCSRCVARMRFVLKDRGCVFCRQENAQVYFTRFMGDYTARLAPEEFENLQARADRRELFALPEINGYFDDEKHFQEIRALCGFTHPILESGVAKNPLKFNNFNSLKRHIEGTYSQYFCDVCLKGRKVFLSEQILYSKDALRRHQETGDESGPMAESGFKGHPLCKFCRTRFYDSNELYRHMEGSHEHCFLCRRAAPDKYVYYRHYKELEDHFTKEHHPCPHPVCLERKFVVFSTEYELKAHFASEHGDEVKMSAAQRRQALAIPLQLQYRSRDDEETEPGASARLERAGHQHHYLEHGDMVFLLSFTALWIPAWKAIVIGGGHNIGSRAARNGRGPSSGIHHSRSEPQFFQTASTSGQEGASEVSSVTFTAEDFPAPPSSQQAAAGALGRWAAFTGAQPSAGSLSEHDFPALPTLSKNQRRRIKEQQRTLAERLSAAAQPPRVLNRAGPGPSGTNGARFGQEEFPVLGGGMSVQRVSPPPSSEPPAASLGVLPGPALSQAAVLNNFFMRPGSAAATTSAAAATTPALGNKSDAAAQLKAEDFPSLPGGNNKAGAKARATKGQVKASSEAKTQTSANTPEPAVTSASAAPPSSGAGGVSDSLKAANKALVERIKRQLSGAAFDTFRQQSMFFMRGELTAEEYHDYMVSLGLLSLVAELVSLCPDTTKRRLLLEVHRAFICSPAAQDPGLVGAGWMPPEAAVAKADRVAQQSAWSCQRCNLCNAPDHGRCEACGSSRPREEEELAAATAAVALEPVQAASIVRGAMQPAAAMPLSARVPMTESPKPPRNPPAVEDFPPLLTESSRRGSAAASAAAGNRTEATGGDDGAASSLGANSAKGKKGKGTMMKIGLPASGAGGSSGSRTHPQNAWTQPALKAKVANSWSGQGAGKVAKMHGAINDAWD